MLTAVFAVAVAAISTVIALLSDSLMAVLYGLIAILMIALNAGSSLSPPGVDEVLSPIRVIKNDLNVAVLGSLLLGAYGILYYLPLYGVSVAIWFGGMCALGRFCCSAFVRYFCAATYGSLRFGLPWAFAKFMDWGRAAGLLRISGAGYQFRHREIKEYLDAVIVGSAPYPGV
ncbi:hypothetical protein GCM10027598_12900 [Amycolatopsis oliviviridis]|uniref:Uncharacterized protein n=2 Tax=Amycolatopsis oliviviridis TaxID=1471590 RepID=A0ABQ3LU74_9PSEU|nr:hypothetical protein GCM10017790_53240 [Amycolatopsis oliviviridis]